MLALARPGQSPFVADAPSAVASFVAGSSSSPRVVDASFAVASCAFVVDDPVQHGVEPRDVVEPLAHWVLLPAFSSCSTST